MNKQHAFSVMAGNVKSFLNQKFEEGYEYKITSKDIVFDCGGNMGLFSLYCASKGATVYSFEPMSYVRDFLKISQSLYPTKINFNWEEI